MRTIRQDFSAVFGHMGRPGFSTVASWACAALAYHAYPLAARGDGYADAVGAAFVLCLPTLFLAYWLGAGMLVSSDDARRSCLPGWQLLARRAKFLAAALLLPTLVLPVAALAENPAWRAGVATVLVLASSAPIALATVARRHRTIGQRSLPSSLAPWLPAGRQGTRDRQSPVRIIRTCLGGMFVQLSARQRLVGAVLLALLILSASAWPGLGASGGLWVVSGLALIAAGLVSAGFLTQISSLRREQLAELALMPGLGVRATQCRALCSVILLRPLLSLGAVLLLGSAGLLLKSEPLPSIGVLAISIFIIWVTYVIFALQNLLLRPVRRQSFISEFVRIYIWVFAVYPAWSTHSYARMLHLFWWAWSIPVLFCVAVGGVIAFSIHRLASAPHPFLA